MNTRFPIDVRVIAVGRAIHTKESGRTEEGWSVSLELGPGSTLRLFLSNATLEETKTVGTKDSGPRNITVRRRPDVTVGEILELHLALPLTDEVSAE